MNEEVVYDSQQHSVAGKTATFSLTPDQLALVQAAFPRLFSLVEAKKSIKKDKREPSNVNDSDSVSQSKQEGRASSRRQKDGSGKKTEWVQSQGHSKVKSTQPPPIISLSPDQTAFYTSVISQLKKNPSIFPFLKPVDPIVLQIPDYLQVIKHPMDISTIQKKMKLKQYQVATQFLYDLNQIWVNSYTYNPKGSDMYIMTTEMQKFANKVLLKQPLPKETIVTPTTSRKVIPAKQIVPRPKKPKVVVRENKQMSIQQRQQLKSDIQKLPSEHAAGMWEIVSKDREDMQATFDLNKLEPERLKKLEMYVKDVCILKKREERKSVEASVDVHQMVSNESSSFMLDSV